MMRAPQASSSESESESDTDDGPATTTTTTSSATFASWSEIRDRRLEQHARWQSLAAMPPPGEAAAAVGGGGKHPFALKVLRDEKAAPPAKQGGRGKGPMALEKLVENESARGGTTDIPLPPAGDARYVVLVILCANDR